MKYNPRTDIDRVINVPGSIGSNTYDKKKIIKKKIQIQPIINTEEYIPEDKFEKLILYDKLNNFDLDDKIIPEKKNTNFQYRSSINSVHYSKEEYKKHLYGACRRGLLAEAQKIMNETDHHIKMPFKSIETLSLKNVKKLQPLNSSLNTNANNYNNYNTNSNQTRKFHMKSLSMATDPDQRIIDQSIRMEQDKYYLEEKLKTNLPKEKLNYYNPFIDRNKSRRNLSPEILKGALNDLKEMTMIKSLRTEPYLEPENESVLEYNDLNEYRNRNLKTDINNTINSNNITNKLETSSHIDVEKVNKPGKKEETKINK